MHWIIILFYLPYYWLSIVWIIFIIGIWFVLYVQPHFLLYIGIVDVIIGIILFVGQYRIRRWWLHSFFFPSWYYYSWIMLFGFHLSIIAHHHSIGDCIHKPSLTIFNWFIFSIGHENGDNRVPMMLILLLFIFIMKLTIQ